MPTYTVRTANLALSEAQRGSLARAITDAHGECTGAPGYFAQVFFEAAASHFVGGRPNASPLLFVHGLIRAGRTAASKRGLIETLRDRVAGIAAVAGEDVWVYLQEIPPEQMLEFGRVLPVPGAEAEWQRGFSAEKLAALRDAGVLE